MGKKSEILPISLYILRLQIWLLSTNETKNVCKNGRFLQMNIETFVKTGVFYKRFIRKTVNQIKID